ncbi:nucleoside-triphosphatase [Caldanaerobacter subterraneus]|uniref:NTPase n=1 Tax=Caldanaerobacter subterraneus TaxID=911092 RepID=A0A7Y2PKQ8_9THEO|nr:nucleoside-triphosphatase [Caldanaerobacter subterraneus]NNG65935.1 hypothetical protein [Caldanaerobacter subterraneus]
MGKVNMITGDINNGKTTKLIEIFEDKNTNEIDGIVSVKVFDERTGEFIGYNLQKLSDNSKVTLCILKEKYHDNFDNFFEFGRFIFSEKAFEFAESVIKELIKEKEVISIIIDEIGELEAQGKGFANAFEMAISSNKEVYIGINPKNIVKIVNKFRITNYTIIPIVKAGK